MEYLLHLCVVVEILVVNLRTVHICSRCKYKTSRTVAVLLLFSLALVGGGMLVLRYLPTYGNGNGMFVLLGFFYLPVLKALYEDSLVRLLEIMCSAWLYTMLVFSFSVQFAYLIDPAHMAEATLAVQSVITIGSAHFFWRFIRTKFMYVLQNIPEKTAVYLRWGSVVWFLTATVVNFAFVSDYSEAARAASVLFLGSSALISYYLLYEVVKSSRSAEAMTHIAVTDQLTGLRNRYSLFQDGQELIRKQMPFSLVYMDLDRFKEVNDLHGHLAGDSYLQQFARRVSGMLKGEGTLYRIAGDEFLILVKNTEVQSLLDKLDELAWDEADEVPFLGVSAGWAAYPQDGGTLDQLLACADGRMYAHKAQGRDETRGGKT